MANLALRPAPAPFFSNHSAETEARAQHSLPVSVILHLLPGAVLTVCYALLVPALLRLGLPNLLTLNLLAVVVLVPMELGILFLAGKSSAGRRAWLSAVGNRHARPAWQILVLGFGLFVWMALISLLISRALDPILQKQFFSWLPAWFPLNTDFNAMPRNTRVVTLAASLICTSWAAPIVEELYFRGYLLPRLSRFGHWAPPINAALFALYHFFTPWQIVSRILFVAPLAWVVQRRRNLAIGITAHLLINTVGILPALIVALVK